MLRRTAVLLLALSLVAAACGDDEPAASDGKLSVVAGFYPLAEAAARVGGDLVDVQNLTPPGGEPHDLELTTRQVDRLEDADLVVFLGGGFQPALEEVAGRSGGAVLDLDEVVSLEGGGGEGDGHGHDDEGTDPHFWLDPRLLVEAVDAVEEALSEASPDDAETFAANADAYREELTALDEEMAEGLGECERDEIVTSHAAFHYLAERYGLTQHAIAGLSPEAEPDPERLAELTEDIAEDGITTVFYETLVSPDVARALAREAGVETAVLDPIEGLSKAQLDDGVTYAQVMRQNLAALRAALACR